MVETPSHITANVFTLLDRYGNVSSGEAYTIDGNIS
jgi:hypothetical protein